VNGANPTTMGQFGAMLRRIPVFQQEAVCLTKFGPESGETADEILARKDLERRSGTRAHKNEFWWGIGEKGAAQSINRLISQHGANIVLFCAIKSQKLPENGSASDILVWRNVARPPRRQAQRNGEPVPRQRCRRRYRFVGAELAGGDTAMPHRSKGYLALCWKAGHRSNSRP
jgi:hypothetical protein